MRREDVEEEGGEGQDRGEGEGQDREEEEEVEAQHGEQRQTDEASKKAQKRPAGPREGPGRQ